MPGKVAPAGLVGRINAAAALAQLVEHRIRNDEVVSSILTRSTTVIRNLYAVLRSTGELYTVKLIHHRRGMKEGLSG